MKDRRGAGAGRKSLYQAVIRNHCKERRRQGRWTGRASFCETALERLFEKPMETSTEWFPIKESQRAEVSRLISPLCSAVAWWLLEKNVNGLSSETRVGPESQPLWCWLSASLQRTGKLFLEGRSNCISSRLPQRYTEEKTDLDLLRHKT